MENITWSNSYETGHPIVDGQHRNLFVLINNLNENIKTNVSKNVLIDIMDKLSNYVEIHFKTEEDLMTFTNYPDYKSHKQEHENLRVQAQKLIELFKLEKVDLTATIAQFLSDWLQHHINDIDVKMITWVKSNEVIDKTC